MSHRSRQAVGIALAFIVLGGLMFGTLRVWIRDAGAAPSAQPPAITVEGFAFKPKSLEVKVGTKVIWTNNDDVTHTVTSGAPDKRQSLFDQTLMGKGAKFEFTFAKAGTVAFFCNRHQSMRGEVVVKE